MRKLAILAFLWLAMSATQAVYAQKLEDNCAIEAWITDKDPNGLNVRDKPNIGGKVVARLKEGKEEDDFIIVYIIGYSNGWAKISSAQKVDGSSVFSGIGWVSAKMVAVGTKGDDGKYDAPAPLYEKASKSSRKIGSIPSETTVQMIGYDCFGLKVTYKGRIGWLGSGNICGNPVTTCS